MKIDSIFLDTLAGNHKKILVFDCEFWHVYGVKGYIETEHGSNEFFMPREVGGFYFQKTSDGKWNYKKEFFITLGPPKDKEVSFISSEFSNTTETTAKKLDELQSKLTSYYLSSDKLYEILQENIKVYLDDSKIKKAHKRLGCSACLCLFPDFPEERTKKIPVSGDSAGMAYQLVFIQSCT